MIPQPGELQDLLPVASALASAAGALGRGHPPWTRLLVPPALWGWVFFSFFLIIYCCSYKLEMNGGPWGSLLELVLINEFQAFYAARGNFW